MCMYMQVLLIVSQCMPYLLHYNIIDIVMQVLIMLGCMSMYANHNQVHDHNKQVCGKTVFAFYLQCRFT